MSNFTQISLSNQIFFLLAHSYCSIYIFCNSFYIFASYYHTFKKIFHWSFCVMISGLNIYHNLLSLSCKQLLLKEEQYWKINCSVKIHNFLKGLFYIFGWFLSPKDFINILLNVAVGDIVTFIQHCIYLPYIIIVLKALIFLY